MIAEAVDRLQVVEGKGLDKLAGQLYGERSQKGLGDFPLTNIISQDLVDLTDGLE